MRQTDFFKPALYNNCAGERTISNMESVGANSHGDLGKRELLDFEYSVLNYNEAPVDKLAAAGFSAGYV
jgi:hypothetical protein